jgi:uncharacterized protein DUF6476
MRALKVLVVVMGVLLVAGSAVLVATIMSRLAQRPAPPAPAASAATRPVPFGETAVTLPLGSKLVGMQATGNRLVLQVEQPDGRLELLVLDPDTGTVLGRIELRPGD